MRNRPELCWNSVAVPLDELRAALPGLDKDKQYIPYCAVGMRVMSPIELLVQNGFKSQELERRLQNLRKGGRGNHGEMSPEMQLWLSE